MTQTRRKPPAPTQRMTALDRYLQSQGSDLRQAIIDLYCQHGSVSQVAKRLPQAVHRRTIQLWLERLEPPLTVADLEYLRVKHLANKNHDQHPAN